MCGIVGVVDLTGITFSQQKFFKQSLYADALRGLHSTGVATLTKKFHPNVFKRAVNASDFLELGTTEKALDKYGNKILMLGHNRHATMGDLIDDNAHPFKHGNITMVHNGSLRTQWQLDDHMKFDVDSEVIAHNLNKNGVDATVPNLNGAFSLVWHDAEDNTLNFIRNSERPMCYAMISDSAFIFGSESRLLEWTAFRNGLSIKGNEIFSLDTGDLMSVDLTAKVVAFPKRKIKLQEDIPKRNTNWNQSQVPAINQARQSKKEADKKQESTVIHLPQEKKSRSGWGLLAELGFTVGQDVEFVTVGWTKNVRSVGTAPTGVLEGYLQDDSIKGHKETWADVEVYCIQDKHDEGGLYRGRIAGAREDKDGVAIVILSTDSIELIRAVPWDDKEEDAAIIAATEQYEEVHGKNNHHGDQHILGGTVVEEGQDEELGTFLMGHKDMYIPIDTWNHLTKDGCANCGGNLLEEDHKDHHWVSQHTILCADCASGKTIH